MVSPLINNQPFPGRISTGVDCVKWPYTLLFCTVTTTVLIALEVVQCLLEDEGASADEDIQVIFFSFFSGLCQLSIESVFFLKK